VGTEAVAASDDGMVPGNVITGRHRRRLQTSEGPKWPNEGPKGPNEEPQGPNEGPKESNEGPKGPNARPKEGKRHRRELLRSSGTGTGEKATNGDTLVAASGMAYMGYHVGLGGREFQGECVGNSVDCFLGGGWQVTPKSTELLSGKVFQDVGARVEEFQG
jgi:hypothetical protein